MDAAGLGEDSGTHFADAQLFPAIVLKPTSPGESHGRSTPFDRQTGIIVDPGVVIGEPHRTAGDEQVLSAADRRGSVAPISANPIADAPIPEIVFRRGRRGEADDQRGRHDRGHQYDQFFHVVHSCK